MSDLSLPKKILYIEDVPVGLQDHVSLLEKQGVSVVMAKDWSTALYQFNSQRFEVVIVSQEFQELGGLSVAQKFKKNDIGEKRYVPILVTSTKTKRLSGDEGLAKEVGDIEFIPKPFSPAQLLSFIARAKKRFDDNLKMHSLQQNVIEFYRKSKNFEKAIDAVKKQLPQLGDRGWDLMLDLHFEAGQNDEALKIVDTLLEKRDNQDIKLVNTKASLLMKAGRHEEARKCFEIADRLAPKNISRMNDMADLYLQMNMPEKSIEKFKDIMKESPEEPDLKFTMFEKLSNSGFDKEAVKFCKEVSSSKEVVRHYNNSGVLFSKDGKVDDAITKYETALKLIPDSKERAKVYLNLAIAHINSKQKGSIQKATEFLKQCLVLDPNYDKARQILERVQTKGH